MSPPNEVSPGTESGADQAAQAENDDSAPSRQGRGAALLAQLRRRNDAARRLPPSPYSGGRDPLSPRERVDGWPRP